jgi:hypothetical protein
MADNDFNIYLSGKHGCDPCFDLKNVYCEIQRLRDLINDMNSPSKTCCVESVNGKTGVVVLTTTDIAEGINLYYSNSRVQAFSDPRYAFKNHTHLLSQITDFPSQSGQGGKILFTNGVVPFWGTIPSGFTDEQAQDAVGSVLVDTSSIDLTYDDIANTISGTVKDNYIRGLFSGSGLINYNSSFGIISMSIIGKRISLRVGDTNGPVNGATIFTMVDCDGVPVTGKEIDLFLERHLMIPDGVDYTYDPATGTVVMTNPLISGQHLVIHAHEPSVWETCTITTAATGGRMLINSTDLFLINGSNRLVL